MSTHRNADTQEPAWKCVWTILRNLNTLQESLLILLLKKFDRWKATAGDRSLLGDLRCALPPTLLILTVDSLLSLLQTCRQMGADIYKCRDVRPRPANRDRLLWEDFVFVRPRSFAWVARFNP